VANSTVVCGGWLAVDGGAVRTSEVSALAGVSCDTLGSPDGAAAARRTVVRVGAACALRLRAGADVAAVRRLRDVAGGCGPRPSRCSASRRS
jgi:hypothetical protein